MIKSARWFLILAALVLTCGGGVYAWKARSPSPVATVIAPVRHSRRAPVNPTPSLMATISDSGQPWQVRIDHLRKDLQDKCGEPEILALYQLLAQGQPKGELPEHWYVIANDLMAQLRLRDPDPQRFSSKMLGLLRDPQQPPVLRDYAVQHLTTWINPRTQEAVGATCVAGSEISTHVLQSLVSAATDPALEQTSIPGTTLMMIVDLVRSHCSVNCDAAIATLKPWLATALQDGSNLATPTRVSAVQAVGVLAPQEFLPILRNIAYQENGQSSLRLPAIAALGQSGDAADLAKLQQIARTHPELAYAARDAHRVIVTRCSQTNASSLSN